MEDILDAKLEEIVIEPISELDGLQLSASDIDKIKQAFIDSGWLKPEYKNNTAINVAIDSKGRPFKAMTGQEWYERFFKESPIWAMSDKTAKSFEKTYLEVARRVAGVE